MKLKPISKAILAAAAAAGIMPFAAQAADVNVVRPGCHRSLLPKD